MDPVLDAFYASTSGAVLQSLPFIGAAVAAGAVIYAVTLGIRSALSSARVIADTNNHHFDEWGNETDSDGYVLGSSGAWQNLRDKGHI